MANCFRKKALYPRVGKKIHLAMKKQKKSEPLDGTIFHVKRSEFEGKIAGKIVKFWLLSYIDFIYCSIILGVGIQIIFGMQIKIFFTKILYLY